MFGRHGDKGRFSALIGALAGLWTAAAVAEENLVLLNWQGYMAPELVERFEQTRSVRITSAYYESDDLRDAMMIQTDGIGYDLLVVNGASLSSYATRGWLAPVDAPRVPNLRHIDSKWRTAYPAAEAYGVPYFWGLIGIAYHADKLSRPVEHWMDLLRPGPELQNRISMIQNAREVTAVALLALGLDPNTTAVDDIRSAGALLADQRPYVKTYEYLELSNRGIESGDILAGLIYSGDWIGRHQEHPEIAYVVPTEGSLRWVDYIAVSAASRHQALAWDFVNFINEPDNARVLADFVQFPSPNRAADAHLSASARRDPVRFPPPEVLARCRPLEPLPAESLRLVNSLFAHISD